MKLGDFGIARSTSRATMRSAGSAMLKGKFAYLAPEQVAGEPFDHRADLFAAAVVLAEMLLGKPLFAGSGQLAVLLAIRDCRIEPLREARGQLPKGLFEVLERALARDPAQRYPTPPRSREALAPFDPNAGGARRRSWARWCAGCSRPPRPTTCRRVRESAEQDPRGGRGARATPAESPDSRAASTGRVRAHPVVRAVTQGGTKHGPWPFARLVEAIATGQVGRGDMVDYMGRGLVAHRGHRGARAVPAGADGDDQPPRRGRRAGLRRRRVDARRS